MSFISEHLETIILAIVTILLGVDKFMSGGRGLRKEIAADYKERNAQLEEKIKRQDEEFNRLIAEITEKQNKTSEEVAGFKATIIEKDKRIQELREDLQGRNPDFILLLKQISESNVKIMAFIEMMHAESKKDLKNQTAVILESQGIKNTSQNI